MLPTERLVAARSQGRVFAQRVVVPLTVGAASLVLAGGVLELIIWSSCERALGLSELDCEFAPLLPGALVSLAVPMLLLVVLPTQARLIYMLNQVFMPSGVVFGLLFGYEVLISLSKQRFAAGECVEFYAGRPQACRCIAAPLVFFGTWALMSIYMTVALGRLLSRRELSSRKRLDGIWNVMRGIYAIGGVLPLGSLIFEAVRGGCEESASLRRTFLWCQTISNTVVGALLSSPNFRARTHAFLSSRSEASAAASGIAAALSSRPIDELVEQSIRLFRGIRLDHVSYEQLVDSARDPKLESLARPCRFLDVDAFVSHSWSDPPLSKWAALQLWRRDFVAEHGREPVVFIDKFCVAQTDEATIAAALECLPLWIAGCQQLVVLFGPTFLSRTWCLIELHTHLEMGGPIEQITLLPVGDGPSAAARPVDVAASKCERSSDRELMLAVIEASAGGSRDFNAQLELLLARLDVPLPLKPTQGSRAPSFILITDPGPDPDDVKALLIAAVLHAQGQAPLRAVVANGGRARDRARLVRCVLDHVGATDVPVGIGSDGAAAVAAQPHEYELPGYASVADADLRAGEALLLEALARAPDKSVSIVCISSLTDFANLCAAQPELVRRKVCAVGVQGGLIADARSPSGWAPDTSQNNEFDREAAKFAYDWCFEHGLPLTVTSRHAVPVIPMQLARSFAGRTECPVMRYLADAQFLGLEGLWAKLCEGKLPARCSKQWFFETFCGVDPSTFAERQLSRLTRADRILPYLDGVVKPYDVVALMTMIPQARGLFSGGTRFAYKGVEHLLLLQPAHAIPAAPVITLLREVYHEVVLATARTGTTARLQAGRAQGGVCALCTTAQHAVATLLGCERAPARRSAAVFASTSARFDSGSHAGARRAAAARGASVELATHTGRREALRTDMAEVLLALGDADLAHSGAPGGGRAARVEPHELELLLTSALEIASAKRDRLDTAAFAFAGTAYVLVTLSLFWVDNTTTQSIPATALGLATQYGPALAFGHAGTIALLASVRLRPGPRVASLVAFYLVLMGLLAALGLTVTHVGVADTVHMVGGDAARSVRGGGDVRALGRALCEVSYLLIIFRLLSAVPRALGTLGWSACARPGRLPPRALSGDSLVRTLWTQSAIYSLWLVCLPLWRASQLDGGPASPAVRCLDLACAALHSVCAVLCVSQDARRGLESVAARAFDVRGAVASLAPLLGYGSARAPDPGVLVAQAQRLFCVVTLGAEARAVLAATATAGGSGRAAAAINLNLVFDPAAAERRSVRGALWAAHAAQADAFAWCTRADEPVALRALGVWAERFEAKEGRPPTVWLCALCADLSLSPAELLAQLPCYLTLCDKLLLLASPRTPLDLHAVIAIHAWRTLGGSASSVEVVLAGGAAERDATVAAFDSFHVMHATAHPDGDAAGAGADERADVAERLELSAQLATSLVLNAAMRELLPAVHAAAAAEGAVAAAVMAAQQPTPRARVTNPWGLCGGGVRPPSPRKVAKSAGVRFHRSGQRHEPTSGTTLL